ncbi:cell division protein FtsL [Ruminiclostridium hungatei]|uniref:Cell division protein FtsL n=1 Tax=Ruminiclostridium hungatei TaxID=48256 RepID=A0A1V4SIX9_RUMHU|nr:septum formation initiator family protein [Ruminiclostridium hungatei]OPX43820.1 cell division protein FtsL [Ruminiclostridium hungatei]
MKKRKKFNIWTLILIVSFCYFGYTFYNQQSSIEERNAQHAQLEKNIHAETVKKQQLSKQKSQINTDEFAEKIAREKLGYVKDGEKIYVDTNK